MASVLRTQVTLNPTASTRDRIMNTWHVITVGATTPAVAGAAFATSLNTFYQAIDSLLSGNVNGQVPLVQIFDYLDPKPRQPVVETTLTALVSPATTQPQEIAACVSYRGAYVSGVSPKSKRGRIYIGPLYGPAVSTSTGLFTSTFRDALALAADNLLTASDASTEWRWVVYSPTLDTAGNGQTLGCTTVVTEGWVDEAPDIQRRRGVVANTRSTFT